MTETTPGKNEKNLHDEYENTAKDVGNMFKHFKLLIIVSFSFVMLYIENLEWMGLLFGAAVNEVIITYIALDFSDSPKHHDILIFVLELILKFKILAEYLIFVLIVDLQRKYTNIGSPIQYSRDTRKKINDYKLNFIRNTILLWVVSFIFFTSYRTSPHGVKPEEEHYLEFFHPLSVISNASEIKGDDTKEVIVTKIFYKIFNYGWYFIKIILVLLLFYTTAVINLIGEEFAIINTTRLYIAENTDTIGSSPSVPTKTNNITGYISNAFSNINLNYVMNYNI